MFALLQPSPPPPPKPVAKPVGKAKPVMSTKVSESFYKFGVLKVRSTRLFGENGLFCLERTCLTVKCWHLIYEEVQLKCRIVTLVYFLKKKKEEMHGT